MKLTSTSSTNSIVLELSRDEIVAFNQSITTLIDSLENEVLLDCEINNLKFKNINKNKVRFHLIDELEENSISIVSQILTFYLELDTYEYMLGLIDDMVSKNIPTNMIEITEITSKKWRQSAYFVLFISDRLKG